MENITYVTNEGLKKLKDELEYLKTEERANVTKLIGEAKSFGDLSENSEYDAAKNKEAEVEMRIRQIEEILKNVKIINDNDIDTSKVTLGCRVRIFDRTYNEEFTYKIMGEQECDPINNIISNTSPVGQALMNRKVNDVVSVDVPDGKLELEVVEILL
ncbi:MAG: transcription elongation factor GreA [Clostridia bacterium]|nr:transcription elongation factor GreA [Clostridia bacterium]